MEPFCSPASRTLPQGEKEKVLTLWGKNKGVTSEQEVEKMDKQESTANPQCRGEAAAQMGGLESTEPLGSLVARVTTL